MNLAEIGIIFTMVLNAGTVIYAFAMIRVKTEVRLTRIETLLQGVKEQVQNIPCLKPHICED